MSDGSMALNDGRIYEQAIIVPKDNGTYEIFHKFGAIHEELQNENAGAGYDFRTYYSNGSTPPKGAILKAAELFYSAFLDSVRPPVVIEL